MDSDQQFIVKLNLGSCSSRVSNFHEIIICSHALVVVQMLNLDTYSYIFVYYHSHTLLSTYLGCVQQDVLLVMAWIIILGLANFVKLINNVIIIVAFVCCITKWIYIGIYECYLFKLFIFLKTRQCLCL